MIFAINIVVPSKNGNAYPECAVNKYPIMVCNVSDAETAVKMALSSIRRYILSEHIFDLTTLYVRGIDTDSKEDTIMKLNELTTWKP